MLGNIEFHSGGAVREELADTPGEVLDVLPIILLPADGLFGLSSSPGFSVGKAFLFRLLQCLCLDEQALPLVALSARAPFQDDCGCCRVFAGSTGQGRVA